MKITLFFKPYWYIFCSMRTNQKCRILSKSPRGSKKRSLECRHKAIISQDCVNAYKIGFPKDEWEDENISNP